MGKRGFISANNALFVSVDLIGEKNEVILEFIIRNGIGQKLYNTMIALSLIIMFVV